MKLIEFISVITVVHFHIFIKPNNIKVHSCSTIRKIHNSSNKMLLILHFFACFEILFAQTVDNQPGRAALDNFPLIDTHNDLAHNLYKIYRNKLDQFKFDTDLTDDTKFGNRFCSTCHTDLVRIKRGKLGAQFWAAYVHCATQHKNAVARTLEQIDVIKRLISKYPEHMEFVTTSEGILQAFKRKKLASLIGVEGGHSIDNNLAILRRYYELGVRYMTLTHSCNTPWANSSSVDKDDISTTSNLTDFGRKVVWEMNRLGMMVDISHVSYNIMVETLRISKAPVIFSHSGADSVTASSRNVRDDVLQNLRFNGGVIMVYFYCPYVGYFNVSIDSVVEHINHIVDMIGVDHVGIGSDFDGVTCVPDGLEDVSKYPQLFDRLKEMNQTRWTIPNLEKLAGRNLIRTFRRVEEVRHSLRKLPPDESYISEEELEPYKQIIEQCSN